MKILKERHISACECAFRLCHLTLKESSRKCIFLNTRKPEQRYNVIKFNESGQSIGYCSNIFNRPDEHPDFNFNTMTLTEFAMRFEVYYKLQTDAQEEDYEIQEHQRTKITFLTLKDGSKVFLRPIPVVIRVQFFNANTQQENFYYSLLLPFRNESELLKGFTTAQDAFSV